MEQDRRRYGVRLGGIIVVLVVVSAGSLYFLYGGREVISLEQVFGQPLSAPQAALSAPSLRAAESQQVRQGRIGAATDEITTPAPPEPEPRADDGAAPPPSPRDVARSMTARDDYAGALRIYDRLAAAAPSDTALLHERARVLAWDGRPAEAAEALTPLLRRSPADAALLLERARYLWWAGDGRAADSALTAAIVADPALPGADALRREIRTTLDPSVAVAERWLRDDSGAPMHLALGRALAREDRPAEALREYALAQAMGAFPDSLHLEIASVALAADSPAVAVAELEVYRADHPADREVAVRLARAYGWAGETERAVAIYDRLLRQDPDASLRYERAALYASSPEWRRAEPDLRALVQDDPRDARSMKLLGDLSRWDGEWSEAAGWYDRAAAIDPTIEGLADGRAEAERELAGAPAEDARVAAGKGAPGIGGVANPIGAVWSLNAEAFGDNQDFLWYEATARAGWSTGPGLLGVSVYQGSSRGDLAGRLSPHIQAWGAGAFGRRLMGRDVLVAGEAGFRWFDGLRAVPALRASIGSASLWPERLQLELSYGPAVRRAASLAALQADVRSTLLTGTAERYGDRWGVAAEGETERLSSSLGGTWRFAGNVTVQRLLAPGLYGVGSLGFVGTNAAAPLLADVGPLYWTPQYYIAPQLGMRYEATPAESWRATLRFAPGYAWVHEQGADRRFNRERLPFLSTGLDIVYAPAPWDAGLSLDWTGALGDGYRAGALRLWVSPHLRWP